MTKKSKKFLCVIAVLVNCLSASMDFSTGNYDWAILSTFMMLVSVYLMDYLKYLEAR